MNTPLYELLSQAALNDPDAILEIINLFKPTLLKFSSKLNGEDTYQELILFLLNLLPKIPRNLPNDKVQFIYIYKSLRHKYIALQKSQYKHYVEISYESIDTLPSHNNDIDKIDAKLTIKNILSLSMLSKKDLNLLQEIYVNNKSIKDISRIEHVSIQAIYKRHSKVIKTLKNIVTLEKQKNTHSQDKTGYTTSSKVQ